MFKDKEVMWKIKIKMQEIVVELNVFDNRHPTTINITVTYNLQL